MKQNTGFIITCAYIWFIDQDRFQPNLNGKKTVFSNMVLEKLYIQIRGERKVLPWLLTREKVRKTVLYLNAKAEFVKFKIGT